jgi:acetyl-CoA acetyltransferase
MDHGTLREAEEWAVSPAIEAALQRAATHPLPKEADEFADSPEIQLIIATLYQLSTREEWFQFPQSAVLAILRETKWHEASNVLGGLCATGIITRRRGAKKTHPTLYHWEGATIATKNSILSVTSDSQSQNPQKSPQT